MSNGKDICKYLKQLRKNIADENNIPLEQTECTFKGECKGTCPHCDAEIKYIEDELRRLGKIDELYINNLPYSAWLMIGHSREQTLGMPI